MLKNSMHFTKGGLNVARGKIRSYGVDREIKKLKHEYMNWCDLSYPPEHIGPMFLDDAKWSSETFGHYNNRKEIEEFFGGISAR